MKYFVMYDKNYLINIVIQMFLIYQGISKQELIEDFDFSIIKEYECEKLEKTTLKKLN